jgi:magnesium transporter
MCRMLEPTAKLGTPPLPASSTLPGSAGSTPAGTSPAEPVPAGSTERLEAWAWTAGGLRPLTQLSDVQAALEDQACRLWVDVVDASAELLTELAAIFDLHHLVAEDIIERNQRAKIVYWDDSIHLVLFALRHDGGLESSEVDVVLGSRFLLTSHPPEWQPRASLGDDGRSLRSLLGQGTDMLLYALIDHLVDDYFPVIDRISDEIDDLEVGAVSGRQPSVIERLFRVRRSLLEIRHLVGPEREILNQLTNREIDLIDPSRRLYFRDVYDLTVRLTDELDTHRDLAGGVLDAYLSSVNNNLSEIMKRLTAVTAVLAGVGAAAGLFGMSEAASAVGLHGPFGFWVVTGMVIAIGVVVFVYFRHIDWI